MGKDNLVFLENIEWFDDQGNELVHRIPEKGSGEIKFGAQLTVRDSQAAVFFYQGKAIEAYGPGRHALQTANIPILTKILSIPWALESPLRAEIYFVNMKVFTNFKWGTRDPVAFKDSELGLIRIRSFGVFNLQIIQPVLFINSLVGTKGMFTTNEIEDYLNLVVVSRFNDFMGHKIDTILNLPSKYDEFSEELSKKCEEDFSRFGLRMTRLYINSITPPTEVQEAIDDRSRMGLFDDMNNLIKMKAAMAMEKASESEGTSGSGMGMGMGLMMPAMFSQYFAGGTQSSGSSKTEDTIDCHECRHPIAINAKFCPYCGHQQLIFMQCESCGKNLAPNAKFCSRCGTAVKEKRAKGTECPKCGTENLNGAQYCNQCGEKI